MPDIDDIEPGEPVQIGAAMRVEEPAAFAADHDPEAVALSEIKPARRVNPDMVERLLLKRCKLARARVVRHLQISWSPSPPSIPHMSRLRTPKARFRLNNYPVIPG